jgi:hypothetical protein
MFRSLESAQQPQGLGLHTTNDNPNSIAYLIFDAPLHIVFVQLTVFLRSLMGSTDQADPSCIYFRIS